MAAATSVAAARIAGMSGPQANSEASPVRKRPLSMASCMGTQTDCNGAWSTGLPHHKQF
jgi:hypothetical protein